MAALTRNRWELTRIVATIASTVAVSVALAGCGGDSDDASGDTTTQPPPATSTVSGEQVFEENCQSCHGAMGAGGGIGPNLQESSTAEDMAAVEAQVRSGGGAMPSFEGTLTDAEIAAVATYVSGTIAPAG